MFFKSAAAKKSEEVQKLLKQMVEAQGIRVKHIMPLGYKFHSAYWIVVQTDAEKDKLVSNRAFLQRLHSMFEESGYLKIIENEWKKKINNPLLEYLKKPGIEIESEETVRRDYKGNWHHRMQ